MGEVLTGGKDEATVVYEWKLLWLLKTGFGVDNARIIAASNVHLAFACRTFENAKRKGYDEAFVVDLLLDD